ncbi:Peptide chain release factor 1 isoform 1 [Schistosoma japonicum]|uniref:Peptide chain release factor 1 isoform 1 n=1 Tax=Schistosoma japonicum TaxID=6182 RepID=A0A4Z2DRY6_SCHJA|nr:Peptide chain release factor 1 isoform 1 [Schistosoma japonicum]
MGKVLSSVRRFVTSYNLEDRVIKHLEANKHGLKLPPRHPGTVLVTDEHYEELSMQNPKLDKNVNSLEVVSRTLTKGILPEGIEYVDNTTRKFPKKYDGFDPYPVPSKDFGFIVPESVPRGRLAMRQAVELIKSHQKGVSSVDSLSESYFLSEEKIKQILGHFSLFEAYGKQVWVPMSQQSGHLLDAPISNELNDEEAFGRNEYGQRKIALRHLNNFCFFTGMHTLKFCSRIHRFRGISRFPASNSGLCTVSLSWLPKDLVEQFDAFKKNTISKYEDISKLMTSGAGDCDLLSLSESWKKLRPLVDVIEELDILLEADKEVEQLVADIVGTDAEDDVNDLKAIAELEHKQRNILREALEKKLLNLLLPVDQRDLESTVIMELFAGAGGKEAGLFAHDLLIMYQALAIQRNWSFNIKQETVMSSEECTPSHNEKSLSYVRVEIQGEPTAESGILSLGAYGQLKWEAGVHRVQRVPVTSSQNKIHTSTVAVSIQPNYGDVDVDISDDDLKWEFHRPTGPGGQNLNKSTSAVRLTHLPTGIIVSCQRERHQHTNKKHALGMLKEKLV